MNSQNVHKIEDVMRSYPDWGSVLQWYNNCTNPPRVEVVTTGPSHMPTFTGICNVNGSEIRVEASRRDFAYRGVLAVARAKISAGVLPLSKTEPIREYHASDKIRDEFNGRLVAIENDIPKIRAEIEQLRNVSSTRALVSVMSVLPALAQMVQQVENYQMFQVSVLSMSNNPKMMEQINRMPADEVSPEARSAVANFLDSSKDCFKELCDAEHSRMDIIDSLLCRMNEMELMASEASKAKPEPKKVVSHEYNLKTPSEGLNLREAIWSILCEFFSTNDNSHMSVRSVYSRLMTRPDSQGKIKPGQSVFKSVIGAMVDEGVLKFYNGDESEIARNIPPRSSVY